MTTPLIFPDAELWATGYLRTRLATYGYPGVFVSNQRGSQTTAVWVRRDGGNADELLEFPRLGVNVYAPTEQTVGDLARTVSALLRDARDGTVLKVTQSMGPSPIADTSPRRFMTFEVTVRGVALNPA